MKFHNNSGFTPIGKKGYSEDYSAMSILPEARSSSPLDEPRYKVEIRHPYKLQSLDQNLRNHYLDEQQNLAINILDTHKNYNSLNYNSLFAPDIWTYNPNDPKPKHVYLTKYVDDVYDRSKWVMHARVKYKYDFKNGYDFAEVYSDDDSVAVRWSLRKLREQAKKGYEDWQKGRYTKLKLIIGNFMQKFGRNELGTL